jgi:hypothetical protein
MTTSSAWLDDYLLRRQLVTAGFLLDVSSVALQVGDAFCLAPADPSGNSVTKATTAALAAIGGAPIAVATESAQPGAPVRGVIAGVVPRTISGLAAGAVSAVRIDANARLARGGQSPSVGVCDANGNVTLFVRGAGTPAPLLGGMVMSVDGLSMVSGGPPTLLFDTNSNQSLNTTTYKRFIVPWQDNLTATRNDTLLVPSEPTKPWVVNVIYRPSVNGGFSRQLLNGGPAGGLLYASPNTGGYAIDVPWDGTNWVFGAGVGGGIQPWGTS